MHTLWEHDLADDHRRELRTLAQTRPRPIRTASRFRGAVGRRLIAVGLRLCLPHRVGTPSRVATYL